MRGRRRGRRRAEITPRSRRDRVGRCWERCVTSVRRSSAAHPRPLSLRLKSAPAALLSPPSRAGTVVAAAAVVAGADASEACPVDGAAGALAARVTACVAACVAVASAAVAAVVAASAAAAAACCSAAAWAMSECSDSDLRSWGGDRPRSRRDHAEISAEALPRSSRDLMRSQSRRAAVGRSRHDLGAISHLLDVALDAFRPLVLRPPQLS